MRHDRGRPSLCGRRHRPIVDAHSRISSMAVVRFTITLTMAAGSVRRFPELGRSRCWLSAATWLNVMRTMRCGRRVHSVHHIFWCRRCRGWSEGGDALQVDGGKQRRYRDGGVSDNALSTVVAALGALAYWVRCAVLGPSTKNMLLSKLSTTRGFCVCVYV